MKRQFTNILIVCVALILEASTVPRKQKSDSDKAFNVTIEQNGKQQKIEDNQVILHKGAFEIVIEMSEPMGILVNASFDDKTFKLASNNKHLDKLPGFEETGMAEGLLNTDKEILLSEKAPSYWFYDTEEENRFNSIKKLETSIICKRTIENLFDTETSTRIKVTDVNKTIYLVFISYKKGAEITDQIEVQRQSIAIEWAK